MYPSCETPVLSTPAGLAGPSLWLPRAVPWAGLALTALFSLSSCSPDVQFCGYCITHPSESKINFRIQTRGTDTAFPLCVGFFWGESPLFGSGFGPGLF